MTLLLWIIVLVTGYKAITTEREHKEFSGLMYILCVAAVFMLAIRGMS